MTKIKALKDYKWGINHQAVSFVSGEVYDNIDEQYASKMVEHGYAEYCDNKKDDDCETGLSIEPNLDKVELTKVVNPTLKKKRK